MKICKVCEKKISSTRNLSVCSKVCRNTLNSKITPFQKGHRQFNSGNTHFKKGFTPWNKGLKGYRAGVLNNKWKGGITPLRKVIRCCFEYRQWRSDVFTRDNFTCILCGVRGGYLEADHYPKMFSTIFYEYKISSLEGALNCEEFWNINNGRTLC